MTTATVALGSWSSIQKDVELRCFFSVRLGKTRAEPKSERAGEGLMKDGQKEKELENRKTGQQHLTLFSVSGGFIFYSYWAEKRWNSLLMKNKLMLLSICWEKKKIWSKINVEHAKVIHMCCFIFLFFFKNSQTSQVNFRWAWPPDHDHTKGDKPNMMILINKKKKRKHSELDFSFNILKD